MQYLPISSNTRGSSNINHCSMCMRGPNGHGHAQSTNPISTARDQVSKDAVVWPTLSMHFAGFAVSFKI